MAPRVMRGCSTAIETALRGTFEFIVRKDLRLSSPRGETPTHWITMAFDPDLNAAAKTALREMLTLLGEKPGCAGGRLLPDEPRL